MEQQTIAAPNGTTKFIKPDFECVLYEEVGTLIYGRANLQPLTWDKRGKAWAHCTTREPCYDLTPVTTPWYYSIGKGKLCWVWSYSDEPKTIQMVVSACEDITGTVQFHTLS